MILSDYWRARRCDAMRAADAVQCLIWYVRHPQCNVWFVESALVYFGCLLLAGRLINCLYRACVLPVFVAEYETWDWLRVFLLFFFLSYLVSYLFISRGNSSGAHIMSKKHYEYSSRINSSRLYLKMCNEKAVKYAPVKSCRYLVELYMHVYHALSYPAK